MTTLYRAAADDYTSAQYSFAEGRDDAEAYTRNPGFGGPRLYRVEIADAVGDDSVLDLYDADDFWAALAEASGLDVDQDAFGGHEARALTGDGAAVAICDALAAKGYRWARIRDDYPTDCATWVRLESETDLDMEEIA